MAYQAPYIDNTGLHTNTYPDILQYLVDGSRSIFGQDIYLGEDSQDYQLLSIFARAIYDEEQCAQVNYQCRSPLTAKLTDALDGLVTINGLTRKGASYSTVTLQIVGIPYTQIVGGVVQSDAGDQFNLPQNVVIGPSGTVAVVATATESGAIEALPGTITTIVTPTYGWTSVTNPSPANVGQPIETNAELTLRQQQSVALPSQTPKAGIEGGIYSVEGVIDFKVYENDTNAEVAFNTATNQGGPANSITCVVEGGNDNEIAKQIDLRKTPGCYTNGDVVINLYDVFGSQNNIRFFRPTYRDVFVNVNITPLHGYTTEVAEEIQAAIVNYLDQFTIGTNLYVSQIWEAALSVSPDLKPYFAIDSVTIGTASDDLSTNNIIVDFSDKLQTEMDKITVVVADV